MISLLLLRKPDVLKPLENSVLFLQKLKAWILIFQVAHFRCSSSVIGKLHENGLEFSDCDCVWTFWFKTAELRCWIRKQIMILLYKLHNATFFWGGLGVSALHSICADLVQRELFFPFLPFFFSSFFFFSWWRL